MEESEIVSVVVEELARGIGGTVNAQDTEVTIALDYYHGRLPGLSKRIARDPNASRYVSTDVMDVIEATLSEIMPMFADEQLALFNPSDQADVGQAELESSLINYMFINEYDGYVVMQSIIKDALLNRNCTVKASWDERASVSYETYDSLPIMAVQQVMQPQMEGQKVDVIEQYVDADDSPIQPQTPEHMAMMQLGEMPFVEETYSIKIRRTTLKSRPLIESIAPEDVIVSTDLRTPLTQDARFIAHELVENVSSLIAQGFDPEIVAKIPNYIESYSTTSRSTEYTGDYGSASDTTRLVRVYDCYIQLDADGDGIAELRHVIIGGQNTMLLNEPVDNIPLIGGCCIMVPHAYQGVSLADRVSQVQDAKTHMIRSIIDGTKLAANQRVGVVTGQVNLDDLLTSITGGIVRVETPNSLFPLPSPDIPNSSYQLVSLLDNQRSEGGGGAVTTANMAQGISGSSAHAVERTMSAMELSNTMLAKTIAETIIRGMFLQLHHVIRKNYKGAINAKIGGKWVSSEPSSWRDRTNVTIQVGSSQGERQRRSAVMTKIGTVQAQLAEKGSILFSEEKLFDALSDGARLDGIHNPERYYVDVTSKEGQQLKQQKEQQSQKTQNEQKQLQQQMAKAQQDLSRAELMKGQAALQSQEAKIMVERAKADSAQQKLDSDNVIASLEIEIEQTKQRIEAIKSSSELQFKYDELEQKTMLKLTELEIKIDEDMK